MRASAPQGAYPARTCGRRGREIVLARDLPIPPSTRSGLDATCASGSNCPSCLAQLERMDGSRWDESRRTISRILESALRTQVPARHAPCDALSWSPAADPMDRRAGGNVLRQRTLRAARRTRQMGKHFEGETAGQVTDLAGSHPLIPEKCFPAPSSGSQSSTFPARVSGVEATRATRLAENR
jgi:hypothetical protein